MPWHWSWRQAFHEPASETWGPPAGASPPLLTLPLGFPAKLGVELVERLPLVSDGPHHALASELVVPPTLSSAWSIFDPFAFFTRSAASNETNSVSLLTAASIEGCADCPTKPDSGSSSSSSSSLSDSTFWSTFLAGLLRAGSRNLRDPICPEAINFCISSRFALLTPAAKAAETIEGSSWGKRSAATGFDFFFPFGSMTFGTGSKATLPSLTRGCPPLVCSAMRSSSMLLEILSMLPSRAATRSSSGSDEGSAAPAPPRAPKPPLSALKKAKWSWSTSTSDCAKGKKSRSPSTTKG